MKRKRPQKQADFPANDQIGAIVFCATPQIAKVPIEDWLHNSIEATQERYGIRLVCVAMGEIGNDLVHVVEPDAVCVEHTLPESTAYLYVRPIPRSSTRWNALPDDPFHADFRRHLSHHVADYGLVPEGEEVKKAPTIEIVNRDRPSSLWTKFLQLIWP